MDINNNIDWLQIIDDEEKRQDATKNDNNDQLMEEKAEDEEPEAEKGFFFSFDLTDKVLIQVVRRQNQQMFACVHEAERISSGSRRRLSH